MYPLQTLLINKMSNLVDFTSRKKIIRAPYFFYFITSAFRIRDESIISFELCSHMLKLNSTSFGHRKFLSVSLQKETGLSSLKTSSPQPFDCGYRNHCFSLATLYGIQNRMDLANLENSKYYLSSQQSICVMETFS